MIWKMEDIFGIINDRSEGGGKKHVRDTDLVSSSKVSC